MEIGNCYSSPVEMKKIHSTYYTVEAHLRAAAINQNSDFSQTKLLNKLRLLEMQTVADIRGVGVNHGGTMPTSFMDGP